MVRGRERAAPSGRRSRRRRRAAIRGASCRTKTWCFRRSTSTGRASCARARCRDIADLDIGSALTHLPLIDLPQRLGCGDVPLWDRWVAHPTLDAYWRAHAVSTNIAKVRAPVLQIAGWYDDSRGPIDYTNALLAVPSHPFIRLVMGPGAHKGVDYVGRRLRPAVARRHAPAPAPLVRPLPARQGQRRRQGAAGRRLRLRRQHVAQGSGVAARARRAHEVVRVVGWQARTRARATAHSTRFRRPEQRSTRSPTIRRIRRRS